MAEFYIFDQDTQVGGDPPIIDQYPDDLDVLDLIRGRRLSRTDEPIQITLAASSGPFRPDLLTYLLPLFSSRTREALADLAVDNIDYYPVVLQPTRGEAVSSYWLANVIGSVRCVDLARSEAEKHPLGNAYRLGSFVLDETKVGDLQLFRPAEARRLILVTEPLKNALAERNLAGVRFVNTREYAGF